jgi:hypothetical protein
VSATAADTAFATELAAVAVERSDAGEGGDLAAIERAELREVTEESRSDALPMPGIEVSSSRVWREGACCSTA